MHLHYLRFSLRLDLFQLSAVPSCECSTRPNVIFDDEIQNIRDAIAREIKLKDDCIIKIVEILDYAILHEKAVVMNFG